MALALAIAGGLLLALFALRFLIAAIDWLDERSSRITPEEARRRAHDAMYGDWPLPRPAFITLRQFGWWSALMAVLASLWYWTRR